MSTTLRKPQHSKASWIAITDWASLARKSRCQVVDRPQSRVTPGETWVVYRVASTTIRIPWRDWVTAGCASLTSSRRGERDFSRSRYGRAVAFAAATRGRRMVRKVRTWESGRDSETLLVCS